MSKHESPAQKLIKQEPIRRYGLAAIGLIILITLGALIGNYAPNAKKSAENSQISSQNIQKSIKTITYDGKDGKNALELLRENHKIEVQESSAGTYVTSIDGVKNTDSSFWLYYINDQVGTVSSDKYQTKTGEKVEWRYETFQ